MRVIKIHGFLGSGTAYNATQCEEEIRSGDVLLIESEGVVGVAHTWPVAVTVAHGELHTPNEGVTWADFEASYADEPDMLEGFRMARALAVGLNLPVVA